MFLASVSWGIAIFTVFLENSFSRSVFLDFQNLQKHEIFLAFGRPKQVFL